MGGLLDPCVICENNMRTKYQTEKSIMILPVAKQEARPSAVNVPEIEKIAIRTNAYTNNESSDLQ